MKTILVTGAFGNLGRAVTGKFLLGKHRVIGTVTLKDPEAFTLNDEGFEKIIVDLLDEEAARQIVEKVIRDHHRIDVAVLTVGGFSMGNISETTSSDIRQQFQLNFETAYHIARPVFQQMMFQNSGRIFLIGSRPGFDIKNGRGMVAYSLAKSLVFRLAELLNSEARGHGVATTVIVPGTIDTVQNRSSMPDADFTKWVTPDSIADLIFQLGSGDAAIIPEPVIFV